MQPEKREPLEEERGGKRKKESPAESCCVTVASTQLIASESRACTEYATPAIITDSAGIMHGWLEGLSAVVQNQETSFQATVY